MGGMACIGRDYKRELMAELINEWCASKNVFMIRQWNSFTPTEALSMFIFISGHVGVVKVCEWCGGWDVCLIRW
jgi:hypothetical protein